ncbi:MAG TPA: methyl-accepting chemotaxis protein [Burkholderiaceae bacterium]|nr:methyl-accepting chemotaxis protein [Burkholderiaceae bacterium]
MSLLTNLKIGPRLVLGFLIVMTLMAIPLAASVLGLRNLDDQLRLIRNDRYAKIHLVNEAADHINLQARSTRNALLMDAVADRNAQLEIVDKTHSQLQEVYAKIEQLVKTDEGKRMYAALQEKRAPYIRELEAFMTTVRAGDLAAAKKQLLDKVRPLQLEYMKALDAFTEHEEKLMDSTVTDADALVFRTMGIAAGALALALVVAGLIAWGTTHSVTSPVNHALDMVNRVANGDLTGNLNSDKRDELGDLTRGLGRMTESLRRLIDEVRNGVEAVSGASNEIAVGNMDLSSRTEQQASSLQETASSMEQLSSTVKNNADTARQANQLAASASQVAEKGGSVVDQVVNTMGEISGASKKIAEIIGVIDGIAFQTNILALNAAVEAARAGEQGRGFAVVAGEVRNLAQRSAEAAKEIKSLISESVGRVETGSQLVGEAGQVMTEIVTSVRRVTDLIGEITSATLEQSSGIEQVNQAVTQLDQTTQQNAALVEQSAAAAQSLKDQAAALNQAISQFRVDGATRVAMVSAEPAASLARAPRPAAMPRVAAKKPLPKVGAVKRPALASSTTTAATTSSKSESASTDWEEF